MILHARALVHVYNAYLELLCEEIYRLLVSCEDRGANSVLGRVDKFYSLLLVLDLLESHNGPKELFTLNTHSIIGIGDNGGLKEPPQALIVRIGVSSNTNKPAHVYRVLADLLKVLDVIQHCHRSDISVFFHGIADLQLFEDLLRELVNESLPDVLVHIDSLD